MTEHGDPSIVLGGGLFKWRCDRCDEVFIEGAGFDRERFVVRELRPVGVLCLVCAAEKADRQAREAERDRA